MGEVYRARDTRLGRDVAVKIVPPAVAANADALSRFERETRAVAALSHPNILTIHDVGRSDGTVYAVLELLEGQTLRTRLDGGALPQRKALEIAAQMARGLAAAHDKQIAHRDLKPENIFVTADGSVKILDFGLARQTGAQSIASAADSATMAPSTEPGVVLGTVGYMAPEQVRGEPSDHRADIFALGCVLYEMLTGRRPFQRDTGAETMTAILKEDPPDPDKADVVVAPGVLRTLRRCLEKRPEERFQSARDLAFALESAMETSSASGGAAAPELKFRPTYGLYERSRDRCWGLSPGPRSRVSSRWSCCGSGPPRPRRASRCTVASRSTWARSATRASCPTASRCCTARHGTAIRCGSS